MNRDAMEARIITALSEDMSTGPMSDTDFRSTQYDEIDGQLEFFVSDVPGMWPDLVIDVRQLAGALAGPEPVRTPLSRIEVPARQRVRNRGADTSWDAAISISPKGARVHFIRIYHALIGSGPMTDEQLSDHFDSVGWPHSSSGLRARRSELVKAGWVRDSGKRGRTKLDNSTIIWEAIT